MQVIRAKVLVDDITLYRPQDDEEIARLKAELANAISVGKTDRMDNIRLLRKKAELTGLASTFGKRSVLAEGRAFKAEARAVRAEASAKKAETEISRLKEAFKKSAYCTDVQRYRADKAEARADKAEQDVRILTEKLNRVKLYRLAGL